MTATIRTQTTAQLDNIDQQIKALKEQKRQIKNNSFSLTKRQSIDYVTKKLKPLNISLEQTKLNEFKLTNQNGRTTTVTIKRSKDWIANGSMTSRKRYLCRSWTTFTKEELFNSKANYLIVLIGSYEDLASDNIQSLVIPMNDVKNLAYQDKRYNKKNNAYNFYFGIDLNGNAFENRLDQRNPQMLNIKPNDFSEIKFN